jgi:phage pi2 protein 07
MTEQLKQVVQNYCQVDNELRALNMQIYEKRDDRKKIEKEIAGYMSNPTFVEVNKLKIEDGSHILIHRPETYAKPWSLSKKELETLLQSYFQSSQKPNAEDCFKSIVERRKQDSVAKEFEFVRVVPE